LRVLFLRVCFLFFGPAFFQTCRGTTLDDIIPNPALCLLIPGVFSFYPLISPHNDVARTLVEVGFRLPPSGPGHPYFLVLFPLYCGCFLASDLLCLTASMHNPVLGGSLASDLSEQSFVPALFLGDFGPPLFRRPTEDQSSRLSHSVLQTFARPFCSVLPRVLPFAGADAHVFVLFVCIVGRHHWLVSSSRIFETSVPNDFRAGLDAPPYSSPWLSRSGFYRGFGCSTPCFPRPAGNIPWLPPLAHELPSV